MSYGADLADIFKGAATYVDKILRGAKPNERLVQILLQKSPWPGPTGKNWLGISFPPSLLATADEVIE